MTKSCAWSDAQVRAVESVPLSEFLDRPVGAVKASCDMSMPTLLYAERQLQEGERLPTDWESRKSFGAWSVQAALTTVDGLMLCYSSSSPTWEQVQVRVWANGTVSAEINEGLLPCEDDAL